MKFTSAVFVRAEGKDGWWAELYPADISSVYYTALAAKISCNFRSKLTLLMNCFCVLVRQAIRLHTPLLPEPLDAAEST